jgi:hypothetical protein
MTAEANARLFALVEEFLLAFERGDQSLLDPRPIGDYCERMRARVLDLRHDFIADNVDALVENIVAHRGDGPIPTPQIH